VAFSITAVPSVKFIESQTWFPTTWSDGRDYPVCLINPRPIEPGSAGSLLTERFPRETKKGCSSRGISCCEISDLD